MTQYQKANPPNDCMSAHHGIMSGLPAHVICVQSKVITLIPRPLSTPNSWLIGTFFGTIQHTQLNTLKAVNKKPGKKKNPKATAVAIM